MAKKKSGRGKKAFHNDPFRKLKGFAVSTEPQQQVASSSPEPETESPLSESDLFQREMEMLGVQPGSDVVPEHESASSELPESQPDSPETDEELFLAALGEMTVRFEDQLPEEKMTQSSPRRMKQFRQGRLQPDATLDLHGLHKPQALEKLGYFLQNAHFQGCTTLLVVTGKGLHSDGEPVLRTEVERFLRGEGRKLVAEWGRAPRQFGGDGALILFLRGQREP